MLDASTSGTGAHRHGSAHETEPSASDRHSQASGGQLGLTSRPGKHDMNAQSGAWDRDLETDLCAVRDWGASTVENRLQEDYVRGLLAVRGAS